jgi:uncharacterized protein
MDEFTLLRVRLTPRGGRDALTKWEAGVLHARVAAPPVDGAANKSLLALLSDTLDVPKSRLSFHSGETSREKVIRVAGVDAETLEERITNLFHQIAGG